MREETTVVHSGLHPERHHGAVNPPVFHASTILSETVAEFRRRRQSWILEQPDTDYGPTRNFANGFLKRFGVSATFFDPLAGRSIESLIRPETRVIYLESPGSLTFEVQDVPAIAEAARRRGITVIADNTWGTPLYFKPFAHGVDVSVQAATKYIVGHSDAMLGAITCTKEAWPRLK